jgi:hypothetical protein
MKVETVEEFLARGGEVHKSTSEISLDQLLFNEGLLDKEDAEATKKKINGNLGEMISKFMPSEEKPS